MSITLDQTTRSRYHSEGSIPQKMFFSGLQEQFASVENDWRVKLHFWQFGMGLVQKLEQERSTSTVAEFNRAYEGLILLLLTLGFSLKEEIEDPAVVEHVKANIENLNSKYMTFKSPPSESISNRLLALLAA